MIEYKVTVHDDGYKFWLLDGEFHREDGPAREYPGHYKEWFKNGALHREDGPAVEYANGNKCWYLNGKKLTEKEFNQQTRKHTIEIDGKTVEISEESYQKMKDSLTS